MINNVKLIKEAGPLLTQPFVFRNNVDYFIKSILKHNCSENSFVTPFPADRQGRRTRHEKILKKSWVESPD
jgi:hypothetical protein